jgi:hypothetical protein
MGLDTDVRLLTATEKDKLREEYINDVALNVDQFRMQCSGYWARGVRFVKARGWLVWEDDESHLHGEEPERAEAVRLWRLGADRTLPSGWYVWNREIAKEAYATGERLWGESWYEHADANSYDIVMQLALLGEVRYA